MRRIRPYRNVAMDRDVNAVNVHFVWDDLWIKVHSGSRHD